MNESPVLTHSFVAPDGNMCLYFHQLVSNFVSHLMLERFFLSLLVENSGRNLRVDLLISYLRNDIDYVMFE